jgi:hypothetical protein
MRVSGGLTLKSKPTLISVVENPWRIKKHKTPCYFDMELIFSMSILTDMSYFMGWDTLWLAAMQK